NHSCCPVSVIAVDPFLADVYVPPHCCFIFFFQAEDGIRDLIVTGVQTCALPICVPWPISMLALKTSTPPSGRPATRSRDLSATRSEERRVGKECRCRRLT